MLRQLARRLPEGAAVVAAGLLVSGVCVFAFLSLSARALGTERYAEVAVLWALVFLVAPGLFAPLEQEVARGLAAREASGEGGRPVVARAGSVGMAVALVLAAAAVLLERPLAETLFGGRDAQVLAFAISLPAYAGLHALRGTYVGLRRFRSVAFLIAGEGFVRLVGGIVVALADGGVAAYAFVIGVTPLVCVTLMWTFATPRLKTGRAHPWRELSGALGALLAASLFAAALLNAGPIITRLSVQDERVVALLFAGLLLVRPPLYLWQGFTVALLPALTRAAEAGRRQEVRAGLVRICLAVGGLAIVSVGVILLAGPALGRLLYGAGFALARTDLVLLALATCAFMLAQALGQGLVALRRASASALAWGLGLLVLVFGALLDPGSARVVEASLLMGCAVAAIGMAHPLLRRGWSS